MGATEGRRRPRRPSCLSPTNKPDISGSMRSFMSMMDGAEHGREFNIG